MGIEPRKTNPILKGRKAKGMSQRDVAESLGVAQATVSAWERGKQEPQPDALERLAKLLGVPKGQLGSGRTGRHEGGRFSVAKTDQELEGEFYEALASIVSTIRPRVSDKTKIQTAVHEIVRAWSRAVHEKDRPPPPDRSDHYPEGAKLICNLCELEVGTLPKGSCEKCGLSCGWNPELETLGDSDR